MSKSLEQLAQELEQWHQDIAAAEKNMATLARDVTFRMLSGNPVKGEPPVKTTGKTRQDAAEAVEAFAAIELNLPLVADVVLRADEKRLHLPAFFQTEKIREIDELLNGESIKMSALPPSLENAGLLTGGKTSNKVKPRELLDSMTKAFQKACRTVLAISKAWDEVQPLVDGADAQLSEMERAIEGKKNLRLGNATAVELIVDCRKKVATWKAEWKFDPLGTFAAVSQVTELRARLENAERERRDLEDGIASAREMVLRLEALGHDAKKIDTLRTWLDQIQAQLDSGVYERVKTSLENWNKTAQESWSVANATHPAQATPSTKPTHVQVPVPPRPAQPGPPAQTHTVPSRPQPSTYVPGTNQHPVDPTRVKVEKGSVQKREKSELERLLDGDQDTKAKAPPAAAVPPASDPALEAMLNKPPAAKQTETTHSNAVEALVTESKGKVPSGTDSAKPNAELGALIEGSPKPVSKENKVSPSGSEAQRPAPTDKAALERLLNEGRTANGAKPSSSTAGPDKKPEPAGEKDKLTSLVEGKPAVKPSSKSDKPKSLDDLFK